VVPFAESSTPLGAMMATLPVSPDPLSVYSDGEPGVPTTVVASVSDVGLTVIVGVDDTVPVIATSCVVAPVLELVIDPVIDPVDALAAIRTSMFVDDTDPDVSVRVSVELKLVASVESSTPVGASTVISAVSPEPLTA
jgi:hypothetical protein